MEEDANKQRAMRTGNKKKQEAENEKKECNQQ